jgi:hypothetical protein
MTRRIELAEAGATVDGTTYLVLADGERVGTATELAHDHAAPWRLTVPGHCANLRRSSRETVLATVTWLLDAGCRRTVIYTSRPIPAATGTRSPPSCAPPASRSGRHRCRRAGTPSPRP